MTPVSRLYTICCRELAIKSELIEFIQNNKNDNDMFVRFTNMSKLGLNPKTSREYQTPVGVCGYQLAKSIKEYGYNYTRKNPKYLAEYIKFPFKGHSPFILFYKYKGSLRLLDSETYTNEELAQDIKKLFNFVKKTYKNILFIKNLTNEEKIAAAKTTQQYGINLSHTENYFFHNVYTKTRTPVNRLFGRDTIILSDKPIAMLWFITRELATSITKIKYGSFGNKEGHHDTRFPIIWTKLFLLLGIGGVRDNGLGIIHEDERVQTIIFSGAFCSLIKMFENDIKPIRTGDIWSDNFQKALLLWNQGKIPLLDRKFVYNGSLDVGWGVLKLPPNLTVVGLLTTGKIKSLPKNLKAKDISGSKYLVNIEPGLIVTGLLNIQYSGIKVIPADAKVRELNARNSALEQFLATNIGMKNLYFGDCEHLEVLPNKIHVTECLELTNCKNLKKLSDDLVVGDILYLRGTDLQIPPNAKIGRIIRD